jgi:hypothetical protein
VRAQNNPPLTLLFNALISRGVVAFRPDSLGTLRICITPLSGIFLRALKATA